MRILILTGCLLGTGVLWAGETCPDKAVPEGFVSLFDGKTMDGWDGDPKFWRVEEGCLTGESTPENQVEHNSFLILRKVANPRDFTIVFDFRMSKGCNSGLSFRAKETAGKPWNILGTHADIFDHEKHLGTIYRDGVLAWRGERVAVAPGRKITVKETFGTAQVLLEAIDRYGWNTFRLEVLGGHMTLWINGVKMAEVQDDSIKPPHGVMGLQMHRGPAMKIQVKNVFYKEGVEP
ncbi:MAG: DUF1080 domain-containing protein [Planctomycetia bacterium]|nr:DUF1080 domain-containing protein [Planctomycetia bacterium]